VVKKYLLLMLLVFVLIGFAFAQDMEDETEEEAPKKIVTVEYNGELKTGLYWMKQSTTGQPEDEEEGRFHNNDDAGNNFGRARFDINMYADRIPGAVVDRIGMKLRFEQTGWGPANFVNLGYVYGYGEIFDGMLGFRLGKLDGNPWAAGGPDIWQQLDGGLIGFRFEHVTKYIPERFGYFNVGFTINNYNNSQYMERKDLDTSLFTDILKETVIGIAYTHKYAHARFSWRFDGGIDVYNADVSEGMELMYRIEERFLQTKVPGFQIFLNGWYKGIFTGDPDVQLYRNWFYTNWDHKWFSSQIRIGYLQGVNHHELQTRFQFYFNIFKWMSLGFSTMFQVDFGDTRVEGASYKLFNIEPQLRFTLAPGTYMAFVYNFQNEPVTIPHPDGDYLGQKKTHWINIRMVLTF